MAESSTDEYRAKKQYKEALGFLESFGIKKSDINDMSSASFKDADADGSGFLERKEFEPLALKIFKEVGAPEIKDVSASVDKTMALFDKDKNGKLDLKEFQMFMVVMTVFMMRGGDKEGE